MLNFSKNLFFKNMFQSEFIQNSHSNSTSKISPFGPFWKCCHSLYKETILKFAIKHASAGRVRERDIHPSIYFCGSMWSRLSTQTSPRPLTSWKRIFGRLLLIYSPNSCEKWCKLGHLDHFYNRMTSPYLHNKFSAIKLNYMHFILFF